MISEMGELTITNKLESLEVPHYPGLITNEAKLNK